MFHKSSSDMLGSTNQQENNAEEGQRTCHVKSKVTWSLNLRELLPLNYFWI